MKKPESIVWLKYATFELWNFILGPKAEGNKTKHMNNLPIMNLKTAFISFKTFHPRAQIRISMIRTDIRIYPWF